MSINEFIGENSFENIKFLIRDNKFKKILIFAGKTSFFKSGAYEQIKTILNDIKYEVIYKTKDYPDFADLIISIKKLNDFAPDLIIAIGGGAVLDLAKISNTLYLTKKLQQKIQVSDLTIDNKFCKLVAVPTTAGSGAEVTSNATLYINKQKYSIESKLICPDYVIIDPHLIMSAPKEISASSGMDAVAQAIESLISKKSNDISVDYAIKSLKYSTKFLVKHINHKSFDTAHKMSLAALHAGKAINISKTTAPHALSYPFTSYYGIKHGNAVSLTLIDFLKFNYNYLAHSKTNFNLEDRFKIIFESFKVNSIFELENEIKSTIHNVGLVTDVRKFNVRNESDINLILSNINSQRLSNNPVDLTTKQIRPILLSKIF